MMVKNQPDLTNSCNTETALCNVFPLASIPSDYLCATGLPLESILRCHFILAGTKAQRIRCNSNTFWSGSCLSSSDFLGWLCSCRSHGAASISLLARTCLCRDHAARNWANCGVRIGGVHLSISVPFHFSSNKRHMCLAPRLL